VTGVRIKNMAAPQEMKLSTREDCDAMRKAAHLCDLALFVCAAVKKSCEAPVHGSKTFAAREVA
jgi:hypothetical protein